MRATRSPRCSARGPTAASRSSGPARHRARVGRAAVDAAGRAASAAGPTSSRSAGASKRRARDIASAKAQFYPNVNLVAFVGLQSLGAAEPAGRRERHGWARDPAITLPIFDAGRLRANLAGKDADYDIAVEQYNQTLADAMRDVVDQLASFRSVDAQRAQQQQALATTREAYDLALLRYREGLGNYLQVLSAEQPLLAQQSLDADLRARELELSINLVRALGGGYEPPLDTRRCRREMNMTMTTHALDHCPLPLRAASRAPPARTRIGARITSVALALAALLLMLNGEVWLLQRTPARPDELTVATCAIDAVDPRCTTW